MRRSRPTGIDTSNAHVRKPGTARQSPDVQASEAQRLLEDPAFRRAFSAVHEGMVNAILNFKHDGSKEADNFERECCRSLRTLQSLKRALAMGAQGQKLRLAEYKPIEPELKEKSDARSE